MGPGNSQSKRPRLDHTRRAIASGQVIADGKNMTALIDKTQVVRDVCNALATGDFLSASKIARSDYPFTPQVAIKRTYSAFAASSIFYRDGFIDRYFGTQLVFPGALSSWDGMLDWFLDFISRSPEHLADKYIKT